MNIKTGKWIFILGTASSALLFLILTADTHRQIGALTHADQLSDEVVAGKRVFEKYNCNDCHTMLGFGGYYAPDLTKVHKRRSEQKLRDIIKQPEIEFANSRRKMAKQNVSDEEITQLIAFLKWASEIDTHDWPPQDSNRRPAGVRRLIGGAGVSLGAALFMEKGCFDCHSLGGVGGDTGPAHDRVGDKYDKATLRRYIANPTSVNPQSKMVPPENLSADEIDAIADFLAKQKGGVK